MSTVAEPYRGLLFKRFITSLDSQMTGLTPVAVKVALQKILRAESGSGIRWLNIGGSVADNELAAYYTISDKIMIINLFNDSADELDQRSKSVNNLAYLLAGGRDVKDSNYFDPVNKYYHGSGELKFIKNGEGSYVLNISFGKKGNKPLGITLSSGVAAYFLGRSYASMEKLSDTEIRNLLAGAASRHKENYSARGGSNGLSLSMKVALGDMEDWTMLYGLHIVKKIIFSGMYGDGDDRMAISEKCRADAAGRYNGELLPLIIKYYTGSNSEYLVTGGVNYNLVMNDFLSNRLEIGLNNVYNNSPDDHKRMVYLKKQFNSLRRNNTVKTIGRVDI